MKAFRVEQLRSDDQPRCFAVIGPDRRVWHESWSPTLLVKLAAKYNEIYLLGFEAAKQQPSQVSA